MLNLSQQDLFKQLVENKFNVYNSLFLNLPFKGISNTGTLLPLLAQKSREGLSEGKSPEEIIAEFFNSHTKYQSEEEQIDFLFRIVQYVERQVVLFDSVEDAAFTEITEETDNFTLRDFFHFLAKKEGGKTAAEKLAKFGVRIVLTAHPTQFYTPAILNIMEKLRKLVKKNDISGIDKRLQQLGLSSLVNSQKPTPFDEAKNILYFLRYIYYDAIGELYTFIKKNMPVDNFENPDIIKLGFWPGGDRDGNPYVTSDVTAKVADELRMTLMKCYYKDIKDLRDKLTFKKTEKPLKILGEKFYAAAFDKQSILSYTQITDMLTQLAQTVRDEYNGLYIDDLEAFIDKIRIFKNHFATLDIRQDHSIHKITIEAILQHEGIIKESIEEFKSDELLDILLHKTIEATPDDYSDDLVKDTLKNTAQLQDIQNRNGEQACNRYIISNSEDIYSVLFVYALFRWTGTTPENLNFDIVPLFESMEGMKNSENIMRTLFEIPDYKKHLKKRGDKQTIMLGFSDGTKDGGYIKANWSIFKTKENLSELCKAYDIKAIFFDGRGGPPARGGGKAHRFYAAKSEKTANHEVQLTIQGQTITGRYGTKEHFKYHTEQLLTAGFSNNFFDKKNIISTESRNLLDELSDLSYEKYTALKNHPKFIPYLENKSTLKYYGRANIASRPAKRGSSTKLTLKDLRAISFVGSWSQLKQNVPGYFGVGTAIKTLIDAGKEDEIKQLFQEVAFFKALILNSMMSLSKSFFELTDYMSKDEEYGEFRNILYEEYKLSKEMVLRISDYDYLVQEEPLTRSSIAIRESIVLPLLMVQQYALQKIEQNSEYRQEYEKITERSLYGNINASRNSA
jgi:phosphoenolpyruvate carboxylase